MTQPNAPNNHDDQPCYAAFARCGCIAAVTVDRPEYARDTAKAVAGWIREGREVRHITLGEAGAAMDARVPKWGKCEHELAAQAQPELAL